MKKRFLGIGYNWKNDFRIPINIGRDSSFSCISTSSCSVSSSSSSSGSNSTN